jgi:hypothetical protein
MDENSEKKQLSKIEQMEALRKQLAELESGGYAPRTDIPKETDSDNDSDDVQVKKKSAGAGGVTPAKRERTEKQKAAFEKAQQTRMLKAEQRRKEREQQEAETKKELEQKLIEKAIKVKKKQIKRAKVIEELSDDDAPIERKSILKKPEPVQPYKIRFV